MKLFLIYVALLVVMTFIEATAENKNVGYRHLIIEQKLDHFNYSDTRKWEMPYTEFNEFYRPGGPLFILVGGKWPISDSDIENDTQIYKLAKDHGGCLFQTQHRYYDKSITIKDLQYLSARQALADLAYFIRTMKKTHNDMKNSKVILAGFSYSGALATWLKKLYPALANGVWASSAFLLAKADFSEFYELVGQSIKQLGGNDCYNRIKNGIADLESMLDNSRGARVKRLLNLCESFDEGNNLDVSVLLCKISEIFAERILYGYFHTNSTCHGIIKQTSDLQGLVFFFKYHFNHHKKCNDFSYHSYLHGQGTLGINWLYQQCNEFGWFATFSSPNQPFGTKNPLTFFVTLCADTFGNKFTEDYIENRVRETNDWFGGLNPDVKNVYWTHGGFDPFRPIGIQDEKLSTLLPSNSNSEDFDGIQMHHSPELTASRKKLDDLVTKWLAQ